jgi:hypothetical protein
MAAWIIVAIVAMYVGIDRLIRSGLIPGPTGPEALRTVPNFVWALIALVVVLAVSTLYALAVRMVGDDETLEEIAAAHRAGVVVMDPPEIDLRDRPAAPVVAIAPATPIPLIGGLAEERARFDRPASLDEALSSATEVLQLDDLAWALHRIVFGDQSPQEPPAFALSPNP